MNTPWLQHYDAGVPRSFGAYPQTTLVDVIREYRRRRRGATNLIFKKRTLDERGGRRASDAPKVILRATRSPGPSLRSG